MGHIIEINGRSVFSLEEARNLLPIIFRITKSYSQKVEALLEKLESLPKSEAALELDLENEIQQLIQGWQTKVQKLGVQPKGLWIADFDSGNGYFCWKFPESDIKFWHKYEDGFSKRVRLSSRDEAEALPITSQSPLVGSSSDKNPIQALVDSAD